MTALDRIAKLEALLSRVKQRADMPRVAAAAPAAPAAVAPPIAVQLPEPTIQTVPPTSVAQRTIELESRTRVVETTMEIDEADLVPVSSTQEAPIAEPPGEIEVGEPSEPPPPSSKRPIPMEAIAEAQQHEPPPPPPPESGKLVAAPPAFDDDFTGVREASNLLPPLEPDAPSIEVQHVQPAKPAPRHEMEAELAPPPPPAASESRRISDVAPAPPIPLAPEITRAVVAAANPVAVHGTVQAFKPATFGELLDATLGL